MLRKAMLSLNLVVFMFASFVSAGELSKEEEYPVVILGGGVASLTAATYLSRGGITPLVLTGATLGGAITQSHNVENWPGEVSISGLDLAEKLRSQAVANGAILRQEVVIAADFSKRPFTIATRSLLSQEIKHYKAAACVIGLGATPKLLNVPGETGKEGYWSRGVYSCAVCDGAFYKDKIVAVVGGGDSALLEAQYLSNIAEKVYVLVRGSQFRTVEAERLKELLARPNIEVLYNTVVKEIKGDREKVTHLTLNNQKDLPVDALFLAIGATPNTEIFQGQLELDAQGYIALKNGQKTSIEGVFAIGDIADPEFKQAVSAAGDGAKAALQAQKFLAAAISLKQEAPTIASQKSSTRTIIEIFSRDQLEKELDSAHGPVFIDFYSSTCPPCRQFAPMYESWAHDFAGKAKFLKVNADHGRELFSDHYIRGIPTVIIFDEHEREIKRCVGLNEILEVNKRLEEMKKEQQFSIDRFRK